jgi:hypothetical protein
MGGIRRRLGSFATGWLALQLAILVSVPTVLCTTMEATAASACTCSHEAGQACPMHHPSSSPAPAACSCGSATDPAAAIVASLLGPAAIPARVFDAVPVVVTADVPHSSVPHPPDTIIGPDAPPPRA